jgi:hypothetical protein
MAANPYDQASRYLLRQFAAPLLAWLLRTPPRALDFVCWLDTRGIPWPGQPDRTCDTVAHLRDPDAGGMPWAVPVEFQLDPDAVMFGRGLAYLGGVWEDCKPTEHRGDRFQVGLVVVNLRGRGRCSRNMTLSRTRLRTSLDVVERNLAYIDADKTLTRIELGKAPAALLPLIPLFKGGHESVIITRWKSLAEQQSAEVRDVLSLALLFAEAAGCADLWREALKEFNMVESQVIKEWTAQARKEGVKEGKLEGLREGKVEDVLEVLRLKKTALPTDLEEGIRAIDDLVRLRAAFKAALSSATVEDFRRTTGL